MLMVLMSLSLTNPVAMTETTTAVTYITTASSAVNASTTAYDFASTHLIGSLDQQFLAK